MYLEMEIYLRIHHRTLVQDHLCCSRRNLFEWSANKSLAINVGHRIGIPDSKSNKNVLCT